MLILFKLFSSSDVLRSFCADDIDDLDRGAAGDGDTAAECAETS